MKLPFAALVVVLAGVQVACTPTFNWREVRAEPAGLVALLPCKPDKAARNVPMAGREVSLQVLGCDAGGATFALMQADTGNAARADEVLAQWRTATLANMRATASRQEPFVPPGATAVPQSVHVIASGQRADGSAVESHAAYFARGGQVFQAVIYADKLKPEAAEPFFSSIKLP
jgi:hypothetical protein